MKQHKNENDLIFFLKTEEKWLPVRRNELDCIQHTE